MTSQKTYLQSANEAFRNKKYAEALKLYELAKAATPALAKMIDGNIALSKSLLGKGAKNADSAHKIRPAIKSESAQSIDIVVPVYNALDDVKLCLNSLVENKDGFKVRVIVINDASDAPTTSFLNAFAKQYKEVTLIQNPQNLGYTKTVNIGLRASNADYVITQNSDTIVSQGWLVGLVNCINSEPSIGICGPLSNAATWQNVPNLYDETNNHAVNSLSEGFTVQQMAQLVREVSLKTYPKQPFVNGFCFMIKREVINKIGYMDEENFPIGYGEENDYCIRAQDAGYTLAIADDVYVYHAKSKSFGHGKRKELSAHGTAKLKEKHTTEKYKHLVDKVKLTEKLDAVRELVKQKLTTLKSDLNQNQETKNPLLNKILFLLPVSGGGGGVHSIVQETMGMRRIGVKVKIAVPEKHLHKFLKTYADISEVNDLFLGFQHENLIEISQDFDVIIATIYTSVKLVKKVVEHNPTIQPAYYIQDYEPLFSEPNTPEWQEARDSYTLVPNAILFAKTEWICSKVYEEHGVKVRKVSPSIDHDVYKPDPYAKIKHGLDNKIVISAMIRPKTPRRGAERTMRLLKKVVDHFSDKVHVEIFGCAEHDPLFIELERDFKYKNSGELTRLGVAEVLQRSDCFIDLSDYQAFGRTGLEAMACNATLITTKFGGVYEYAVDNINCLLVNPLSENETFEKVSFFLKKAKLSQFKLQALITSSKYNIHCASLTLLIVLNE